MGIAKISDRNRPTKRPSGGHSIAKDSGDDHDDSGDCVLIRPLRGGVVHHTTHPEVEMMRSEGMACHVMWTFSETSERESTP